MTDTPKSFADAAKPSPATATRPATPPTATPSQTPAADLGAASGDTPAAAEPSPASASLAFDYAQEAAALRAEHSITPGRPKPTVIWLHLATLLPWLEQVHRHCTAPAAHLLKAAEWLLDNEFHLRRAVRQVREDMPAAFYRRLPRLANPHYRQIPRVLALARGMLEVTKMQIELPSAVAFVNAYQRAGSLTMAELWAFPAMLRLACLEELVQAFSTLLPALAPPFALPAKALPEKSPTHLALQDSERVSCAISALVAISTIAWPRFFEQVSQVEALLRNDPAGVYEAMDFATRDRYRHAVEDIAERAPITETAVAAAAVALAEQQAAERRAGHVGYWLVAEGRDLLERQVAFRPRLGQRVRRLLMAHPGRSYALALVFFTLLALVLPSLLLAGLAASVWEWCLGLVVSLAPALLIGVTLSHWLVTRSVSPRVLPKFAVDNGLQPGWETAVVMPIILRHATEVAPLIERLEMHWLSNPDPRVCMALLSDLADADSEQLPEDAVIEAALLAGVQGLNSRYAEQAPFALLHRRRQWNKAEGRWMGWERKRGKLEALASLILGHEPPGFTLCAGEIKRLCQARFVVTLDADTRAPANHINRLIGTLAHPLNRVEFDALSGRPLCGYTFIQPRVEISPDAGVRSLFTRLYSGDTAIDIYSRAVSDVYQDLFGEGIFTGKGAFDVAAFHHCLQGRVPENAILSHDLFEGLHGRAALASDIVFYEDFPDNYLSYARRALRWIRGDWQLTPWLGGTVPCRETVGRETVAKETAGRDASCTAALDRKVAGQAAAAQAATCQPEPCQPEPCELELCQASEGGLQPSGVAPPLTGSEPLSSKPIASKPLSSKPTSSKTIITAQNPAGVASRFSALDRWKLLDNLRRSLVAPMLVLLAVVGWLLLPGHALIWTVLTVSAPASHLLIELITRLLQAHKPGTRRHLLQPLAEQGGRWLLSVIFLAHEAAIACQGIGCALWRMHVSHRHLLEWTSAAHSADEVSKTALGTWREMAVAPIFSLCLAALLGGLNPPALVGAAPLLLLWFISPQVAWLISRERPAVSEVLGEEDRRYLRLIARRTWLYFETFAGPDNNWLPADNYQAPPHEETAHRSSPTNVGMLFLAALTAWDLGHIGRRDLAARTLAALDALDRLESHDGHTLNWFDTRTLESLAPRYISTVDSGNLAMSLLTLSAGCREAATGAVLSVARWHGLEDSFYLLLAALDILPEPERRLITEQLITLIEQLPNIRAHADQWHTALLQLDSQDWQPLKTRIAQLLEAGIAGDAHEIHLWLKRSDHHLMTMSRDLDALAPWHALLDAAPPSLSDVKEGAIAQQMAALRAALPQADTSLAEIAVCIAQAEPALAQLRALCGPAAFESSEALDKSMPTGSITSPSPNELQEPSRQAWLQQMALALARGEAGCRALQDNFLACATRAEARAFGMAFHPLYDSQSHTFFIGYNLDSGMLDLHHYDLLASEARLASYFAIAKRDVPVKHWFHLGRPLSRATGELTILSWNGSMFEYLMPALLLPSEPGRLLGQSERAAVWVQQQYAAKLDLPWGVSESAFAARNDAQHYQYQAFGVPGLGLKHGLAADYVVAPYASGLALCVAPLAATANLRRLEQLGLRGRYGFHEAADFTPQRRPSEGGVAIVRSYMAHHQGMMSAAIGNALHDNILIKRLGREPRLRATELLLQERVPWEFPAEQPTQAERSTPDLSRVPTPALHGWSAMEHAQHTALNPHPVNSPAYQAQEATFLPPSQLHVLGNGRLSAWVTDTGDTGLWWRGQALTQWSGDPVRYGGESRIYISQDDATWSLGGLHANRVAETRYHAHKIAFHERKGSLLSHLEIAVAPNYDVEFRRVTLVNDGEQPLTLVVTSYAEVVLAPLAEHERHPAFSKLFIHSEHLAERNALIFERRPRHVGDHPPVLMHRLLSSDAAISASGFATDRRAFLGRHGNLQHPPGAATTQQGTSGWTLDPIMSLQAELTLAPGAQVRLDFVTLVAESRAQVLQLAERFATGPALDWAAEDAQRTAALAAQRLGLDTRTLAEAQALCGGLIFPRLPTLPLAMSDTVLPTQPHLWSMRLSGDLPILLVRISHNSPVPLLATLIRVHRWWQKAGLKVDLVCLQAGISGYQEPIRELLFAALREVNAAEGGGKGSSAGLGGKGGIHLLACDRMGERERRTLEATASLILDAAAGSLASALAEPPLARSPLPRSPMPRFQPLGDFRPALLAAPPLLRPTQLAFDNTLGGFITESGDYLIHLEEGRVTPNPWCNVLANEHFGSLVSEAGLGFTWSGNSGEHRLTPWSNDAVLDPQSEALYVRDEETAAIWTPTPLPAGGNEPCQIQHHAGATTWRRNGEGLVQQLTVLVAPTAPVKLVLLTLTNPGSRGRRLTITYYAQWLMGAVASTARPHLVCGFDAPSQALMARNDWDPQFAGRTAFLAASRAPHSLSCDRASFLGRHQDMARPAGLLAWNLDGALEQVADACAAFQVHLDLAPGATEELVFVLGEGADHGEAAALAGQWAHLAMAKQALADNEALWQRRLGGVQVTSPDAAFDIMVNRWLLNQTLASRILARAGFQQASGAFGFRDQLQDMLALLFTEPKRVRTHILESAAHQFEQGDVLHWWHPPTGRGVKTRCSDDLLWLVYATGRYVTATGDTSILTEEVAFLTAAPLAADEADRYAQFETSPERASLFEHCRRALEQGVTQGVHGLPLMGSGDWNDGMDRVGDKGRGESVWLAWFAADCADAFAELALRLEQPALASHWQARGLELRRAADAKGWDGEWYARAFDDEGLAWGAKEAQECQIDSISQSWAALAGGLSPQRTATALKSATEQLLDREARLIRLLTPPFEHTLRDPGYIRAYPPGVRENGGQYTHAAAWLGLAHARLGNGNQAYEIFDLINPIRRSLQLSDAEHYRGEPYVLAADIRGAGPYTGQAGWTWYTGAAGWTWQLAVEGILGLSLQAGRVRLAPCLPRDWGKVRVRVTGPAGVLDISIEDPRQLGSGQVELSLDGQRVSGDCVAFPTDGTTRTVLARLGPRE